MGPLLDALYEDTKEKVLQDVNLKDPDTFVTVSMDAWKAPSGQHIRIYMLNSDRATFFFDATDAGTTRPSGVNIGNEALAVINAIGAANVAAVANDNAPAETTSSWETIRDAYASILCTGYSCHGGNLLFKDLFEHTFAKSLLEKCVKAAKFYKHHLSSPAKSSEQGPLPPITRTTSSSCTEKRSLLGSIIVSSAFCSCAPSCAKSLPHKDSKIGTSVDARR